MAWIALFIAGLFEIVWAVSMKFSDGFSKTLPTVITLAAMWVSFALLSYALKSIPLGTAYGVWVGIGAVGVALVGMFWWNEPTDIKRIACISLIVVGVVGLKLLSGSSPE